jgi:hypothetical protein
MRALLGEMWMTTVIMPLGRLMGQDARASTRDEAIPVQQARGFAPCSEQDCLPPEPQPGDIGKYPASLARSGIEVSEAHGDPGRGRRKPRRVAADGEDGIVSLTNVIGKPYPWWSVLLQIYIAE